MQSSSKNIPNSSIQAKQEIAILKCRSVSRQSFFSKPRGLPEQENSKHTASTLENLFAPINFEEKPALGLESEKGDNLDYLTEKLKEVDIEKITVFENCDNIGHYIRELHQTDFQREDLESICGNINSPLAKEQLFAVVGLRKILSRKNPPIQAIFDLDVLERLKALLAVTKSVEIKTECAWIMINLALGNSKQVNLLVQQGVPQILVKIVSEEENFACADDASWALGNIACEGEEFRLCIIEAGGIQALIDRIKSCVITNRPFINLLWSLGKLTFSKKSAIYNSKIMDLVSIFINELKISDKILSTIGLKQWLRIFINFLEHEQSEQQRLIFLREIFQRGTINRLIELLNNLELISDSNELEIVLLNKALIIRFLLPSFLYSSASETEAKYLQLAWTAVLRNIKLSENLSKIGFAFLSRSASVLFPIKKFESQDCEQVITRSIIQLDQFLSYKEEGYFEGVLNIYISMSENEDLEYKIIQRSGIGLITQLTSATSGLESRNKIIELFIGFLSRRASEEKSKFPHIDDSVITKIKNCLAKSKHENINKELEEKLKKLKLD